MKPIISALFFTLIIVNIICFSPPLSYSAEESLKIGIFPRRNSKVSHQLFTPMANYLSQKLDYPVTIETSRDFNEFWDKLINREYDLVHLNQYHYVVAKEKFGYQVIAINSESDKPTIAGSIIVRKDSGINTVADLKGKKIVFGGGPKAMQSYIYAAYLLHQGGLQPDDYITEYALNPPNAIKAAYFKQADAAGSGDAVLFLDVVTKSIDTKQLKFLVQGRPLPHLPWAVKGSLDPDLIDRIKNVLFSLKESEEGRAVLKAARLSDLVPASDKDFDEHRHIIEKVTGEQY